MTNDDTVYVPKNTSTDTYHTDPECRYVNENHRERSRQIVEAWGYEECGECAGDDPATHVPSGQSTNIIEE